MMTEKLAGTDTLPLNAVFHALSDEKRRDMVARLSGQSLSVKDIAGPLGMRMPSAVKHLAILEACGLVVSKKAGRVRTYAIRFEAFGNIRQWIEAREITMNKAFDRLEQAIAQFPEDTE
jgi:DNA-binding transcriptional ArsR family regulator